MIFAHSRRRFLHGAAGLGVLGLAGVGAGRSIAQSATPALPERFDINHLMGPVKDQGERKTCAAFAMVASAEAAFARDTGARVVLSEDYLMHKLFGDSPRPADETTGPAEMIDIARKHGFALAEDWPYQPRLCAPDALAPGCQILPPDLAAIDRKADQMRVPNWVARALHGARWDSRAAADARALALAEIVWRSQAAVIFATALPDDGEGWGDDGMLSIAESLRGKTTDELDAGPKHIAVLTGFDLARREFQFKNSWGVDWGRGGYGTIPFDLVGTPQFFESFFWARKPIPA